MPEFNVEWGAVGRQMKVNIRNPRKIKNWGQPLDTVYAILCIARWGEGAEIPDEYRRRQDYVSCAGDKGVWRGVAGGYEFKITNTEYK